MARFAQSIDRKASKICCDNHLWCGWAKRRWAHLLNQFKPQA